jgi:hypothetical protein
VFYPPTMPLLPLHELPVARPGYDIPPAIAESPRLPRVRALAARLTRTRPTATGGPAHCQTAGLIPDCDQASA